MSSFSPREKKILGLFLTLMIFLYFAPLPHGHRAAHRAEQSARGGRQEAAHAPFHFGAIAISPSSLVYGTTYDYETPIEAQRAAINFCKGARRGVSDCHSMLTFADTCAAVAIKPESAPGRLDGGWGVDYDASTDVAGRNAVAACERAAGGGCKVDYTYCSK